MEQGSAFAINHIGAYIDNGTIDTAAFCGLVQSASIPQVMGISVITDTSNWTNINGNFIASGNERFITIGNFSDANHTDTSIENFSLAFSLGNTQYSWYLIDDVSVIDCNSAAYAGHDTVLLHVGDTAWVGTHDGYVPCRWYRNGVLVDSNKAGFWVVPDSSCYYMMQLDACGTTTTDTMHIQVGHTGLGALTTLQSISLYPNPAGDVVNIGGLVDEVHYQLQSLTGSTLQKGRISPMQAQIDVSALPEGVYFLVLSSEGGERVVRKVVKG